MLEKTLIKGTPDWHNHFNRNAAITEDKLTLKALCTYDEGANAYAVELLNVPVNDGNGDPLVYPDALPDVFAVVAQFPNDYAAAAHFTIGAVSFTAKYASFATGDIQQINFDKVNNVCYFSTGAKIETDPTVPAWAKTPDKPTYTAAEVGAADKEDFDELAARVGGLENLGHYVGTFDTAAEIPPNTSAFEGITPNDFINIRADENHGGATTRYIAEAFAADGTITWAYDITYSMDMSGKLDADAQAVDSAKLGGKLPAFYLGESEAAQQLADGIYQGVDLTVKFAAEIAAAPYSGDPWTWIRGRKTAGNFSGLHVGDYIPFTATNGYTVKAEIAGINTYKRYGDTEIGNHIDFISRDLWPDTHVFNKVNYNNGTTVSPYPWLASDLYAYLNSLQMNVPNTAAANPALVAVDYRTTGVYDKLPTALKNVIITKRLLLPQRYTAGSLLTNDNTWGWADAGKLWIPSEIEVYGCEHWGSKNGYSSGGYQQYAIFAHNMKRVKGQSDGGARAYWWLSSPYGGNSSYFAFVSYFGYGVYNGASSAYRAPVCFRI